MNSKRLFQSSIAQSLEFMTVLLSMGIGLSVLLFSVGSSFAAGPVVDLSLNQQDVLVKAGQAQEYLGEVSASGDFNGDGYDDLLLGAAGHNHNGSYSGAAYMILGGPNLAATINLASSQANLTIYGSETNAVLGHAVAAGDVNGDGVADMIVAADGLNTNRGAVYVFPGGAGLFTSPATIDLAISGNSPALTIKGEYQKGRLGRSVASGDINGDGYDDIVIGAYTASPAERTEAGVAYVILGDSSISSAHPEILNLSFKDAALKIYGAAGAASSTSSAELENLRSLSPVFADEIRLPSVEIGDRLGRSVAVGDINMDGIDDVIASAYGANVAADLDAGTTYVFYGNTAYSMDTPTSIDLAGTPNGANVTLTGIDPGDQSGFYVASGDLNKDTFADILIGAYFSQGAGNATGSETGEVYVVYGAGSLAGTIDLATGSNLIVYGAAAGDRLGRSLAAGDVNADGFDDLIAGASRADPNGRVDAGEGYIVYGSSSLPASYQLPTGANIRIQGAQGNGQVCDAPVETGSDCSDEAGHAVASGDINGDGVDDFIVMAIYANNAGLADAGAAYILYGSRPTGVLLTPETMTISAGQSVTYFLSAVNKYGSWDVSRESSFSISPGAGGSWDGNVYRAGQAAGEWTVTGRYQGIQDTALLVIGHGPAASITVTPDNVKMWVDSDLPFTVNAVDEYGNPWDVTAEASFSISPGAGGFWNGNVYTSQFAGSWIVTATYQGFSDTSTLIVSEHDPAVTIEIQPIDAKIYEDESIAYTVLATDANGVTWDASRQASFDIDSKAGGSWNGNIYTSSASGKWKVAAIYQGLLATTTLQVMEHGRAVVIWISRTPGIMTVGEKVDFKVTAQDIDGNAWNVTSSATLSIDPAAGGSWSGNVYTTGAIGEWTVTAQYKGLSDTERLVVVEDVKQVTLPMLTR